MEHPHITDYGKLGTGGSGVADLPEVPGQYPEGGEQVPGDGTRTG